MAVWKAEHSGLSVRPHLLRLSQENQVQSKQVSIFCKVCLLVLSTPESFYKHCSTLEHAQLLSQDTITNWKQRQPPHGRRAELCPEEGMKPKTCEYGSNCPKAHSEEELKEWMMRSAEEKEIRCSMETEGLMCYNQQLLDEYRNSSNEVYVLSENVDDVRRNPLRKTYLSTKMTQAFFNHVGHAPSLHSITLLQCPKEPNGHFLD
uniref:C3H1-type domain-containing protein n=1 Tax=Cyprinodon variegatus TaxID=28743 RepID=A0A3Q2DYN0_CYPVA